MSSTEPKGRAQRQGQKDAIKSNLEATNKSEDNKYKHVSIFSTVREAHPVAKKMEYDEPVHTAKILTLTKQTTDKSDNTEKAPNKYQYLPKPISVHYAAPILFHSTHSKAESIKTDPDSSEKYLDAKNVVHCEPCLKGQKHIQAHGFCINCSEYLCISCFNSHNNYKAFKNHALQGYDEMPTDAVLITVEDHCLKHEGKPLEYFCRSCDELACTVCMFKQHRTCENVDYIPDIAGNLEESDEYKQLIEDIQCLEQKFTASGKTMDASLKTSEESRDHVLAKIKEEADEVKKTLDRLTTKMNNEVQKRFEKEQDKLTSLKEENKEHSEQLKLAHNRIKYSKKARQMNKLFISVKKERKAVDDLEKKLQKLREYNGMQSYTFKASKSLENFKILSELGDLQEECLVYDDGSDSISIPLSSMVVGDMQEECLVYDDGSDSISIPSSSMVVGDLRRECQVYDEGSDSIGTQLSPMVVGVPQEECLAYDNRSDGKGIQLSPMVEVCSSQSVHMFEEHDKCNFQWREKEPPHEDLCLSEVTECADMMLGEQKKSNFLAIMPTLDRKKKKKKDKKKEKKDTVFQTDQCQYKIPMTE